MDSNFENDLSKEIILGKYLDDIYSKKFKGYNIERIKDLDLQHQGIDLIITKNQFEYYIDEKAQLDYINTALPTFAFEISYLKNGVQKKGWLFDNDKKTQKYFLITGIFLNNPEDINKGFKSCIITSVDRNKLIKLLESRGLTHDKIQEMNLEIRSGLNENAIPIKELNSHSEGKFYFSKNNKAEQPINLVLKIDFLIKESVAKKIH